MLPAAHRLRGKRAIRTTRQRGVVYHSPQFVLRVFRRGESGPPRVLVAVGRRVSTRAVDRNRVTRWIREALREELLSVRSGIDLSISATAPEREYRWRVVVAELRRLLTRAGVRRAELRRLR